MSLTPLWITLGSLAAWSVLIILLVTKVIKAKTKCLECPPPNFMNTCKSGARYDMVNLNYNKMILVGIFILPFRIVIILITILITTLIALLFKLLFCGS